LAKDNPLQVFIIFALLPPFFSKGVGRGSQKAINIGASPSFILYDYIIILHHNKDMFINKAMQQGIGQYGTNGKLFVMSGKK